MTNVDWQPGGLCGTSRSAYWPARPAAPFRVGPLGGRGLLRRLRGATEYLAQADVERLDDPDERLEGRVATASLDLLPVFVADLGATRGFLLGKATRLPLGSDSGADLADCCRGALSNHGAE
jgi:hypothetical protein